MSGSDPPAERVTLTVAPAEAGWRLDAFLAHHLTDYSRVHLRRVIAVGAVRVDGGGCKPSYRLKPGQRVELELPEIPREGPRPEEIPVEVLYEDLEIAVVNKPPGMVVHPARGHWSGTLAAALQFRFGGSLSTAGGPTRPGIVHRLDRDTSGLVLVAKNDQAHARLAAQFESRTIRKEYFAIVAGAPQADRDVIDEPIGLHPHHREKMAIRRHDPEARRAETFFEVLERFRGYAALRVLPRTGRTHQIRVHMDHIGCPVLCDRLYGGRARITRAELCPGSASDEVLLARQALHAGRLEVVHPSTGERMTFEAPLPLDLLAVLEALREGG
ncbi:MAG: RluA family pseudouridine synthase [Pirellulales bacterium]|nr:RluA family pseudouridine synthase [Pirellulales bacterium]